MEMEYVTMEVSERTALIYVNFPPANSLAPEVRDALHAALEEAQSRLIQGAGRLFVLTAPISLKTFLWVKFAVYGIPLLILEEILIVSSNILLQVTSFMMVLSVVTVFLMTPGVVALEVGLGAAYLNSRIRLSQESAFI